MLLLDQAETDFKEKNSSAVLEQMPTSKKLSISKSYAIQHRAKSWVKTDLQRNKLHV